MNNVASIVLMAFVLCTNTCDKNKVRGECWKWKNKAGKMVVAMSESWTDFYSKEADRIGDKLIEEHKNDPGWTEEMAAADYKAAMAGLDAANIEIEKAEGATAEALEAFEEALDAWRHATDEDASVLDRVIKTGRDCCNGLTDMVDTLTQAGVEVPKWIVDGIHGFDGIVNVLTPADNP